jgi:hypothetical protein
MKMRGVIAGILVLSFLIASFPARAERITTDSALYGAGERARIMNPLQRDDARVAALTDQEAALLASQIDTLPAGAADAGILVVAIATVYCVVFWYVQTRRLNR